CGPSLRTTTVNVTSSPTFAVELFTVFVSDKSATLGTTCTLAWSSSPGLLLPGVESTSYSFDFQTCAVFVLVPDEVTVATIVKVAVAPGANAPTSHTPVV